MGHGGSRGSLWRNNVHPGAERGRSREEDQRLGVHCTNCCDSHIPGSGVIHTAWAFSVHALFVTCGPWWQRASGLRANRSFNMLMLTPLPTPLPHNSWVGFSFSVESKRFEKLTEHCTWGFVSVYLFSCFLSSFHKKLSRWSRNSVAPQFSSPVPQQAPSPLWKHIQPLSVCLLSAWLALEANNSRFWNSQILNLSSVEPSPSASPLFIFSEIMSPVLLFPRWLLNNLIWFRLLLCISIAEFYNNRCILFIIYKCITNDITIIILSEQNYNKFSSGV